MELARPCLSALLVFLLFSSVAQSCNNGSVRLTVVRIDIYRIIWQSLFRILHTACFNYAVYYYYFLFSLDIVMELLNYASMVLGAQYAVISGIIMMPVWSAGN